MTIVTNTGTTAFDIIEFIVNLTTLEPGASLEIDPKAKKIRIGDVEITFS